jgi:hypothetical protein
MEITYDYRSLPVELKKIFANLYELNQALRTTSTKI